MSRRISFRPLIFLVLCLLVVMYLARTMSRQGDITYSAMRENFVQEKVQSFTVSDSRLTATLKDQTTVTCPIRDFTLFYDDLNDLVVASSPSMTIPPRRAPTGCRCCCPMCWLSWPLSC